MRTRFRLWLWQFLVSIDQLAHVGACFWTYVLFGRGSCPTPDETISSRVGRNAIAGKAWALVLERLIDGLFVLVGDRPGHCRANIEWDELDGDRQPGGSIAQGDR